MTADNDRGTGGSGNIVLTPASDLPTFDPFVQSFIDRWQEGGAEDNASTDTHDAPGLTCFRPAGSDQELPVLIYLQVATGKGPARRDAMQRLADLTQAAVLLQDLDPGLGIEEADHVIAALLDAIPSLRLALDATRIALGGDDLGALAALAFASGVSRGATRIALLILVTPALGSETTPGDVVWPTPAEIVARSAIISRWFAKWDWSEDLPPERLTRLPPTLLITAEIDPYRRGAERLAQRMMAADCELSAVRMLGTIHDFTWLPALLEARPTLDAHALMTRAVREQLFPLERTGG